MPSDPSPTPAGRSARRFAPFAAGAAAAALIAGVAVDARARSAPVADLAVHAEVRAAVDRCVPRSFREWLGTDVEPPAATVSILRPNAILRRDYVHLQTGERVSLLVVHCSDVRDLVGHYPPVCYPAHGFVNSGGERRSWAFGDRPLESVRYRFGARDAGAPSVVVDNFMVLPGGGTAPDMDAIERAASDFRVRHRGAGQVQVVTDGGMSAARRDAVFGEFAGTLLPVLREALSEVPDER